MARDAGVQNVRVMGVVMPISTEMVLDWYALTDPEIRKHNPSLLALAERLLAEED